jgi:surfactin synthase thioesterase subunit
MPSVFDELADASFEGLRCELAHPYVLFGHSFGGMLAYEVARRVAREGEREPAGGADLGCTGPARSPA